MKVVHLSTAHIGGAGLAARRLNSILNANGVDSEFYSLQNISFIPKENEFEIPRNIIQKFLSGILTRAQNYLNTRSYFTLQSFSVLNAKKLNVMFPASSVLHVHNWFNLLNYKSLVEILDLGYQIVFTLHDMRLITGGCHYSFECNNFKSDCSNCPLLPSQINQLPSKIHRRTKAIFDTYPSQVAFVAPSKWLYECALDSNQLPSGSLLFIPNIHSEFRKSQSVLPLISRKTSEALKVGIASLDPKSYIKGGDILKDLISEIEISKSNIELIYLSDFDSLGKRLEDFWENIDVLLVPSRADNSPNVIHEAKLNFVPIIAANIGGISELINLSCDIAISPAQFNSKAILTILRNLELKLGEYRVRIIDDHYFSYVSNSVQDLTNLYTQMTEKN